MAQTEAQRRAALKYRKKTRTFSLVLYPSDADIVEWLDGQESKAGAIRQAIREYMENHEPNTVIPKRDK